MLLLEEPEVLLAQDADLRPKQAGLLLLLCEFAFDTADVVPGLARAPVLHRDTLSEDPAGALRALRAGQSLPEVFGEAVRPLFQTVQLLLGDPLGSLVLGARAGQLFLEMVALDGGGPAGEVRLAA
ncbi:hypothetical protein J7E99_35240 [Streptomyces sp. ISL-44]|uniref:hypothetical protein n=1 Tax=Streptomyces sp. ISL-44 TaxID=2819184 RepID=UPI001BE79E8C|nr:hypothetical protein [Streptomyces sp. ISL-44]MBT2545791.1 hypothetical protein [Streptomyces sp. ISL-44]